jgi:hypothetical protein
MLFKEIKANETKKVSNTLSFVNTLRSTNVACWVMLVDNTVSFIYRKEEEKQTNLYLSTSKYNSTYLLFGLMIADFHSVRK